MDEALALPSEKAVLIALRTQQIIAHESGVASSVDPLGGGFMVEALTNQIEENGKLPRLPLAIRGRSKPGTGS